MPLAPKRKLHNPFHCPSCPRVFQTRGGLSQHYRKKHRKASSPLTDHCDADLSNKNVIPLLSETIHILPDIGQIVCCCPEVIIRPSSPESETRLPEDNELYTDGNTDTEDSDLDISVDIYVSLAKLPVRLKFGEVLLHPNARCIYDTPGQEFHGLKIQKEDHRRLGHPYHPWSSENELWLSNFIFFKAKMSVGVADVMMRGIRDGRLRIDGLAATRAHKMLSIIDNGAKYVPVSSI